MSEPARDNRLSHALAPPSAVSEPSLSSSSWSVPPRRVSVRAACEACRRKKRRCTGERPKCSICIQQSIECKYTTRSAETHSQALKRRYHELLQGRHQASPYEELFELMRSMTAEEALELFRRIKAGHDISSLLAHVKDGNLLLQLRLVPEVQCRFEFPWRRHMPAYLQRPENLYLDATILDGMFKPASPHPQQMTLRANAASPYVKPLAAAKIVDPRLELVKPSAYTQVCQDDALMRKLLHAFFLYEYPWLTCFHKDDFLDDMLAGREEFCTPLMVNVLLAFASHCVLEIPNRAHFWKPQTLGYRFLAEARRLWDYESQLNMSLPTVQAACFFHMELYLCGLDQAAYSYMTRALQILDLLGLRKSHLEGQSIRFRRSRAITTWYLFWAEGIIAYHMAREPRMKEVPSIPVPDPNDDPDWFGEIWLKYPLDQTLYPMHHPHCLKAKLDLVLCMHAVSRKLYGAESEETESSQAHAVADFAASVKKWYRSLPNQLHPKNLVFPIHYRIHTEYQKIAIEVQSLLEAHRLPITTLPPAVDAASSTAVSRACLETLFRLYYLRHGFNYSDTLMVQSLNVIAFAAIAQLENDNSLSTEVTDDLRSSLILAAKGLFDQGQNWHVMWKVFMAVQNSMAHEDLELLNRFVNLSLKESEEQQAASLKEEYMQSQYMVDVRSPEADKKDPEARRLGNILRRQNAKTASAKE